MTNPYKVLGVNESATNEEIRAAYLSLVKKYHPDKYTDPDMKQLANEKLKEINEAYDQLTKNPGKTASSGYSGAAYGAGGHGGSYSGPEADRFVRARSLINAGNLDGAKTILDSIQTRNAEWYYLYGIIYLRQGWYDKAGVPGPGVQDGTGQRGIRTGIQHAALHGQPVFPSAAEHKLRQLLRVRHMLRPYVRGLLLRMHGRRFDTLLLR